MAVNRITRLLKHFVTYFLQQCRATILPIICIGCGKKVSASTTICADCWQNLYFLTKPYCPIMGIPFRFDIGNGMLSGEALRNPPPFDRARAVLLHQGLAQKMVSRLKYGGHTELAPIMAHWMVGAGRDILENCDYVLPLPLHNRRFRQRGYNQAAELARHIARECNKSHVPHILIRKKYTIPQVGLDAKHREKNVRGVFAIRPKYRSLLKGKKIVLVDDVYTTGATVKAVARLLRRAGTAEINILTFSHVIKENSLN